MIHLRHMLIRTACTTFSHLLILLLLALRLLWVPKGPRVSQIYDWLGLIFFLEKENNNI